ncbi:hypothetical protein J7K86_03005 [bacterium]|nr:hypothetical protein [bacterium]
MIPRSRGGKNDDCNIKMVPEYLHRAWHQIFDNYTPYEIVEILRVLGKAAFIRGNSGRGRAWKMLFGDKTIEEVIDEIKKDWTPKC